MEGRWCYRGSMNEVECGTVSTCEYSIACTVISARTVCGLGLRLHLE